MLSALAELIVPSDGDGPGARDTRVAESLERHASRSAEVRARYARGLAAIDLVARRHAGSPFLGLPPARQLDVLGRIHAVAERVRWRRDASWAARVRRRLARVHYSVAGWGARHGMGEAHVFFPRLVDDVLAQFWTSRQAWQWVSYDGPPMSEGYPDLGTPRGA
ncbi:MAG: gluconate 2-dehydrogenase subunit 3 family protein [Candidatus Rokubacteria bacterium]|nr:gluconate 2-dehydrogenase subunit 3 family protein [Candidatus Rokubacteria bacterium]